MTLTLTLENTDRLENGEPTQLKLDRHGAVIGRSSHSDWSLPDAKNYISSTHCEVEYRDGAYVLIDKSTNGTFLNDSAQRMPSPYPLADGDLLTIGQYRVRVQTSGGAGAGAGAPSSAAAPAAAPKGGWDAWGGGGGSAPGAPAPAPSPGWDSAPSGWAASSQQPAASSGWAVDAAPAPEAEPAAWGAAPTPAAEAGWGAAPAASPASPGWGAADTSPSASGGWDAPSPAAPAAGAAFAPPGSAWGAEGAGPAQPRASGWDAIGPAREASDPMGAVGSDGAATPVSGRGALSQSWAPPRVETPAAPPPPPAPESADVWGKMTQSNTVDWNRGGFGTGEAWGKPVAEAAAASAPAAPSGSPGAAWDAFLQASGVTPETLKAQPVQAAATAGALLKHLVAGLVVMLEARARAKAQLGAQSTTLELKGNNPIKFARSPERVLAQLLSPPERGFMGAEDAVQDSFRDLQAHQMATLAAMQGALRSTLERFSPEAIRQRAEMRGLLAKILPSARDASLWQAYEREFEGVAKGSDEAFMDVFAKAFKAAYEQAAIQMKSQGR